MDVCSNHKTFNLLQNVRCPTLFSPTEFSRNKDKCSKLNPPGAILTEYEWKFVDMLIWGRNKFFNWKLSKDICTRKEKLLLDSEKFLFSWWELVSGIRYFPPLQTQAQIITTNMMGPSIVRDVYHMCREANANSYHMCIQRSRPATTPVSKIHYAKKVNGLQQLFCNSAWIYLRKKVKGQAIIIFENTLIRIDLG